jgi:hypothetical protein
LVDPVRRRPAALANGRSAWLDLDGLLRLLLEAADEVGHVGHLLLEVALVLLEVTEPLLAIRDAPPAEAGAASVTISTAAVHVHLPSFCS